MWTLLDIHNCVGLKYLVFQETDPPPPQPYKRTEWRNTALPTSDVSPMAASSYDWCKVLGEELMLCRSALREDQASSPGITQVDEKLCSNLAGNLETAKLIQIDENVEKWWQLANKSLVKKNVAIWEHCG